MISLLLLNTNNFSPRYVQPHLRCGYHFINLKKEQCVKSLSDCDVKLVSSSPEILQYEKIQNDSASFLFYLDFY